ncbi:SAV_915 family protein [Prescottella defluvii]|uniref:SAV_915 family protein n=1 Tax=Prescottella defluvii TaxID=1323361 RepID=UPI000ADB886B|nr:SAV_915 family protein [Prescottella defluvii]
MNSGGSRRRNVLYVPVTGRPGAAAHLELRRLPDGRLALPAYTSLQQLVSCCGPHQPWGAVDDDGLREVGRATGYDVVLLDAKLPPEHWKKDASVHVDDEPGDHLPPSWLSRA